MGNSVVHFEISGPDGLALQEFYQDLFGWQVAGAGRGDEQLRLGAVQ